jgi:hypothetical protein
MVRVRIWVGVVALLMTRAGTAVAEPSVAAVGAFDAYVRSLEARRAQQHGAAVSGVEWERLRRGEFVVERLDSAGDGAVPGAMLHHWRGMAFLPGVSSGEFERVLRDFAAYPRVFAPEVLSAKVLGGSGDRVQVAMRVRQKHVIAVVMDTSYDVTFGRGESVSRSTRVEEIASPGMREEHALSAKEEHGFLWRQNTYWSYEERDGGVLVQVESVSLSRAIPRALAWAVGPFVESVPRESLEFTLRSACSELKKKEGERR